MRISWGLLQRNRKTEWPCEDTTVGCVSTHPQNGYAVIIVHAMT